MWQGTGQQRVGSVSPALTFADMIHTERASSEGEEMGVWEGGVEKGDRGCKKESVNNEAGEVVEWEKQKTRVQNKDG